MHCHYVLKIISTGFHKPSLLVKNGHTKVWHADVYVFFTVNCYGSGWSWWKTASISRAALFSKTEEKLFTLIEHVRTSIHAISYIDIACILYGNLFRVNVCPSNSNCSIVGKGTNSLVCKGQRWKFECDDFLDQWCKFVPVFLRLHHLACLVHYPSFLTLLSSQR